MNPNPDIIKDFSNLQASNQQLVKSNVELAGKLLALQEKINNLKAYEVYVTTVEENLPLVEALKYLTEEHIDSGFLNAIMQHFVIIGKLLKNEALTTP